MDPASQVRTIITKDTPMHIYQILIILKIWINIGYLWVPLSSKWSQVSVEIMTMNDFPTRTFHITKDRIPNTDSVILSSGENLGAR